MIKKIRRFLLRSFLILLLMILVGIGLWRFLLPSPIEKTEIFQGIFYTSEKVENIEGTTGRMMAFEIELDAPGLEFFIRPLDPDATEAGAQYILKWPDLEVLQHDLAVLVNGALYRPGEWWRSYPGAKVSAVESLVIDGELSHLHEHSYLLWLDDSLLPRVETTKPPPAEAIRQAKWAIGLQELQINNGKVNSRTTGSRAEVMKRTFIGIDPKQRKLWLLVFEAIDSFRMANIAREMGVLYGGQLDSGDGSWGVVGPGAKDVGAMTGIRSARPLASYLGIRAAPIQE